MMLDELIETAKGRHVRTSDVLRSVAKLVRPTTDENPDSSLARRHALARKLERLADTIDARGCNT
jgi:hypothetical protein